MIKSATRALCALFVFMCGGGLVVAQDLATMIKISPSSMGTVIVAGTRENVVGIWNVVVNAGSVERTSMRFAVQGSADNTDIRNVKLVVNGITFGAALASVPSDGIVIFDISKNPATLHAGANNVQVRADVMGSQGRNFRFTLANTGTSVAIANGTITLQTASDTPRETITPGQSGVTLAKFTAYAASEAVRVRWFGWGLNVTGATGPISDLFANIRIVDDAAGQMGKTINKLGTPNICTDTAFSNKTAKYRSCFGNRSDRMDYVIPANTTRVLSLKADVKQNARFESVTAIITANTNNARGVKSGLFSSTGGAYGARLTTNETNLMVRKDPEVLADSEIRPGFTNVVIGSYTLVAPKSEDLSFSTITITMGATGAQFQNLRVLVHGRQFGATQVVLSNSTAYTFADAAPIVVSVEEEAFISVYADALSSASVGTHSTVTTITGCSANGTSTLIAINCPVTPGQNATVKPMK